MNSLTAMTSTASTLQDPITLPRELFLQLFTFLHSRIDSKCKFILDSSTVSREWRDVILSSPTLFEDLYLYLEEVPKGKDSLTQHAIGKKMINKLMGYANLSNNRLKNVSLCLSPFLQDIENAYSNWHSTRFSVLFNVLSWSSSTLTSLKLKFRTLENPRLASAILHVAAIIKHLDMFKCLREVAICSGIGMDLKSSSLCRNIRVYAEYGQRVCNEEEIDDVHGSTLAILFHQMTEFTGGGIESVAMHYNYPMSLDAFKELERSRESLSDLDLDLRPSDGTIKAQLILNFPNITKLDLRVWNPEQIEGENQLSLEVPKSRGHPIKLKELRIEADTGPNLQLMLGEEFCQSLYFLQTFYIRQQGPSSLLPITDSQRLQQLLSSSSSSLQFLKISRMALNAGLGEGIQLHRLVRLDIAGDANLIKFFLEISYNSLRELYLTLWEGDEGASERALEWNLIRIFESCQSSLQIVHVRDCNEVDGGLVRVSLGCTTNSELTEGSQSSFALPKLFSLALDIGDEMIIKHYLPIHYPILSEVALRESSKLSQSDFL